MLLRPSISQEYYVTEFTFCRHVGTGMTASHRWRGCLMLARAKLNPKRTSAGICGLLHLTLDITMHHIAIQDMLILCVNDVILLITIILFSVVS